MGDRTTATITIYGRIETLAQFGLICSSVIAEAACDADDIRIQTEAEFAAALLIALDAPEEGLFFQDDQVNYGTLRLIEENCRSLGLPFVADWESGDGFGPGRKSWHPDFTDDEITASTVDGAVAVSIGEIRMAMEAKDPMAAIAELIILADKINGEDFPPISVSDAVLAHLKSLQPTKMEDEPPRTYDPTRGLLFIG